MTCPRSCSKSASEMGTWPRGADCAVPGLVMRAPAWGAQEAGAALLCQNLLHTMGPVVTEPVAQITVTSAAATA